MFIFVCIPVKTPNGKDLLSGPKTICRLW